MELDHIKDVQQSDDPKDEATALTPEALESERELTDDELVKISGGYEVKGQPPPPPAPPGHYQVY